MTGIYGPATDQVQALFDEYLADVDGVRARIRPWYQRRGNLEPEYRMLKQPRDFAWTRFHEGLDAHECRDWFDRLWEELRVFQTGQLFWEDSAAWDAICAPILSPFLDQGPFRTSDFDVLMAPWRAGVECDARSRLFLSVASHPPFDRDFWPTVDAALSPVESSPPLERTSHALPNARTRVLRQDGESGSLFEESDGRVTGLCLDCGDVANSWS